MPRTVHRIFFLCVLWAGAPAHAQLGAMLDKLVPPELRASEPARPFVPLAGSTSSAMVDDAAPVGAKKDIQPEMRPDVSCNRPQERFNVAEKVAEFGGMQAALRLQRLIESDYKYSDLEPQDKEMLGYLARTTVWVPVEVEAKLGAIYDMGASAFRFGKQPTLSDLDRATLDAANARLNALKGVVQDFPADIKLNLDKTLPDGASARFGGVILLSERFAASMTESPAGSDFLLAHELSHIYKRHAIKDIQFKLISTEEGWGLARKVLQRAQRGMAVDPIADGVFMFTTVPALVQFVRSVQLKFGRDQELEADACAVVWLNGIGSDPVVAWDAYRATVGASSGAYIESHPPSEEREARFKVKAAGQGAGGKAADVKDAPPGKTKKN